METLSKDRETIGAETGSSPLCVDEAGSCLSGTACAGPAKPNKSRVVVARAVIFVLVFIIP
jgi:hypothetical protein